MVDYFITAVHFSQNIYGNDVIHSVKVGKNLGTQFETPTVWSRQEVIVAIEQQKKDFMTLYRKNGTWNYGDDVIVVVIDGVKYIKTDGNRKQCDNLGEIEKF